MTWRLFIDDERMPVCEDDWYIARDYNDARCLVLRHGLPIFISFDHDLGDGPSGAAFVDWLIEHMLDEGLKFSKDFNYFVHSQNPVGTANIRGKMDAAIAHIGYES